MRQRLFLSLLCALACLAFACGDDNDEPATSGSAQSTATRTAAPATQAAAPPAGAPSATQPPPIGGPNALSPALLALTDLPQGWASTGTATQGPLDETSNLCGDFGPYPTRAKARAGFSPTGGLVATMEHSITEYAPGVAKQALDDLTGVVTTCGEFKLEQNGAQITYRMQPLEVPALGDQTMGARFSVHTSTGVLTLTMVLTRRGDLISGVLATVQGEPAATEQHISVAMVTDIARKADARLAALNQ